VGRRRRLDARERQAVALSQMRRVLVAILALPF